MRTYMAEGEPPKKPQPKPDPGWDNPAKPEPVDKGVKPPKGKKVVDLGER
jgi:hypothetical protein